nr:fimbria/pilus outer membrane usher protein [Lelliottia sp. WAP21]
MFCITITITVIFFGKNVGAIEFNTDVLDIEDRNNIDFSRFSEVNYVIPGNYEYRVTINSQLLSVNPFPVRYVDQTNNSKKESLPCITQNIVEKIGLTPESLNNLKWWDNDQCADFSNLRGTEFSLNMATGTLNISMPKSWLEYSDGNWVPASRWDDGIPGILLDYNINSTFTRPDEGEDSKSASVYGSTGANLGAWRLRADYQGNIDDYGSDTNQDFDWQRIYMYRALPSIESNLTIGENYISSDIFDSWNYTGINLSSDERMLPPHMRGFAPQITGIAATNARVVVRQQGRILYDATVPAGSFTIQDLDSSVRGRLDVEVIEQNGEKKYFHVNTGYVPFLTRPGQMRYKFSAGRAENYDYSGESADFISGETAYGINNTWSIFGGTIVAEDYTALSMGSGWDIPDVGTLSAGIIQARSSGYDTGVQNGKAWRLNYSRNLDEHDASISFTGDFVTDRDYVTMPEHIDALNDNESYGNDKESYTVSLNKDFKDAQININLQYQYQTYWDENSSDYYSLSINHYFDMFDFKNVSASMTASRSDFYGGMNDAVYFRLSIPWGTASISYSGNMTDSRFTQLVGYNDTLNNGLDSYNLNVGLDHGGGEDSGQMSAFYNHNGKRASLSANVSTIDKNRSLGFGAIGGMTITAEGAALHAGGINGGTRLLVDTDGVSGVAVDGGQTVTNPWGIGVVTDISSYYTNTTSVDIEKLPKDVEAVRSVVESTLTEGAIGHRKFDILRGNKLFAVIKRPDGTNPPFGASVKDVKGRELGLVGDSGLSWLSGINPGDTLNVVWSKEGRCNVDIPENISSDKSLLLPCEN